MSEPTPAWRNLKLGVFFLLGLVVFMGSLFIVGTNQHLFRGKYDLKLYLDNAQGLNRGAMIALSGLQIGRVKDLTFANRDSILAIEVLLNIEKRYQERITPSSMATIRTQGVLGDKFVDISLGNPNEDFLRDGDEIIVRGSIDWTSTFERGVGILDDLSLFVTEASKTMQKLNQGDGSLGQILGDPTLAKDLHELISGLNSVTRKMDEGNGTLARLIKDPSTLQKVDDILDRVDRVATEAEEGSGVLNRLIYDESLGTRLEGVLVDSENLIDAIHHEGTTGKLISDESLYNDLQLSL
ncbi:MAG: MCE family protein, partial [Candidatus Eisenbacteria bacterium]|nr:MCE family protein [Candidatus Eisenbacteria bacterium]